MWSSRESDSRVRPLRFNSQHVSRLTLQKSQSFLTGEAGLGKKGAWDPPWSAGAPADLSRSPGFPNGTERISRTLQGRQLPLSEKLSDQPKK